MEMDTETIEIVQSRLRQSVDVKVLVSFSASESPEDSIQPGQS